MVNVVFNTLEDENKSSEFINFVNSLPQKDKIKLLKTIQKIQDYGIRQAIKMEWVKKLDDGFTKKTKKTPPKEILRSQKMIERYKRGELNELNF